MKKLLVVSVIGVIGFYALKRYQKHVNKAPNIEY
ncbi:SE2200 family small protein [Staphylococcus saprophyticus]|nr:SE2200 family small protein [Staphylococcus saprophyticus]